MTMNELTSILSAIEQGDPKAAGQLLPLVYDELRAASDAAIAHAVNEFLQSDLLGQAMGVSRTGADPDGVPT
jgi:hypothetical protein